MRPWGELDFGHSTALRLEREEYFRSVRAACGCWTVDLISAKKTRENLVTGRIQATNTGARLPDGELLDSTSGPALPFPSPHCSYCCRRFRCDRARRAPVDQSGEAVCRSACHAA